ncbi:MULTISPECIES: hypothetical protein [Pantoea]|uniref:Uncharacterized protein n=1 Tax=Candidatus Pantoea gossypiicola TaxID=2608008 RepID=A0AB34CQE1_9GAMM|nr:MULTISPECIES: hypothetical protein [Pantoea]KAA5961025.1 hypothetical protein F3I55_00970 [Pantoea sp. VH_24]KAA5964434.1 hypothetical protein F3I53_01060 [Pantoea sp. VH_16]KAA5968628.1 hypothetical protein F3I54_01455 [Pantoea sp. VH_18]KAA6004305.1 hypothetical protein F3I46_00375 [Pantoea sp. M_1]KAA6006789.1 hypothetical protein F3I45_01035 [Pantoea sp. F_7]
MFSANVPIIWALAALALGFIAGYMVGLFRWKNAPAKAATELLAIRDAWKQAEAHFQAQIDELKAKLDEKFIQHSEEARNDASKKSLLEN